MAKIFVEFKDGHSENKTFKNDIKFIEWARKNAKEIYALNGITTFGEKQDHFVLMDIFMGGK